MPKFVLMISIVDHIEYLVSSHECVVIPGLGALIVRQEPTRFDDNSNYFKKPTNEMSFNAQITHNDGLLVNSVAKREQITYEQALTIVESNVSLYKKLLANGDDVTLGHVGYLKEINSHIEFVPCISVDKIDPFFGLNSFRFMPLSQSEGDVGNAERIEEQPRIAVGRRNLFATAFRTAASVVLLACLTLLLTTPVVNTDDQALASLEMPKVSFNASNDIWNNAMQQKLSIAKPANVAPKEEGGAQTDTNTTVDQNNCKYHLIVASLTSAKQAQKYIDEHKDKDTELNLRMYQKRKVFYVYADKGNDYGNLLSTKKKLSDDYSDAWILY